MCNTYCLSTVTVLTRTGLDVIRTLPLLLLQLCGCYSVCLMLLGSVIYIFSELIIFMCTLILLTLLVVHNLKFSPRRNIELKTIFHTQFVCIGLFIICRNTEFHFPVRGH